MLRAKQANKNANKQPTTVILEKVNCVILFEFGVMVVLQLMPLWAADDWSERGISWILIWEGWGPAGL
eukprot:2739649-Amphidinium_carterae.1